MKLPHFLSLVSLFALSACDNGAGDPSSDVKFRGEGGSGHYVAIREAEQPVKKKGCDPEWWRVGEKLISFEEAEEEWAMMIKTEAVSMADEVLNAAGAGLCSATCKETGGSWTGEVSVEESWHEVGATDIVGECAFGTFATETEVLAAGAIACTCEG